MLKSIEAIIDENGEVHLKETLHLPHPCRAILTIIEELEEDSAELTSTAMLSEKALAVDWDKPEEDAAWSHLQ